MITAVALLFFPVVLAMSLFRMYQLPRDLLARKRWVHPQHKLVAGLASGTAYIALVAYSGLVLYALFRFISLPPRTLGEVLKAASVAVGYPLVYLAYEWVYFYAILPRAKP